MRSPPFFLVWREGGRTPVFKHADQYLAEKEAERLASITPGEAFYVLAPTLRVRKSDFERERFEFDGIPF